MLVDAARDGLRLGADEAVAEVEASLDLVELAGIFLLGSSQFLDACAGTFCGLIGRFFGAEFVKVCPCIILGCLRLGECFGIDAAALQGVFGFLDVGEDGLPFLRCLVGRRRLDFGLEVSRALGGVL